MTEVLDRAKDIMFSDKTLHSLKMAKVMTRQIQLIEKLYEYFEKSEEKAILQNGDSCQMPMIKVTIIGIYKKRSRKDDEKNTRILFIIVAQRYFQ